MTPEEIQRVLDDPKALKDGLEQIAKDFLKKPKIEAIHLIEQERKLQIEKGFTAEHDDKHRRGEIATAGVCYAALGASQSRCYMDFPASQIHVPKKEHLEWPFEDESWRPSDDKIRNLVRAGALIVAEIERLQRIEDKK